MASRAPYAEVFQEHVLETILPSIRRYGSYQANQQLKLKDEALSSAMVQLTMRDQELNETKEELKDAQEYANLLKDMMVKDDPITKDEIIYISTSSTYAAKNLFKVGGVKSESHIRSRFSQYNGNRVAGDEWFYSNLYKVHNFRHLEDRLKVLMDRFKDKKEKELYKIHYTSLRYIVEYLVDHYNDEVDEVNHNLSSFIANLNTRRLRPIIPTPFKGTLGTIVSLNEDGSVEAQSFASENKDEFMVKVEQFVLGLPETTTSISRREVFDRLDVRVGRKEKLGVVQSIFNRLKPNLTLTMKK